MTSYPPTLSVVVPVYCGAKTVSQLVTALGSLEISGGHEIILVDDGSIDNSVEICRALLERSPVPMTLVSLSRNYGEHNAVLAGLRHARGDWVITMDDDLQNPPSEVERLLDIAKASGNEVVYTYYSVKQHAPWRNLGSRFTNWTANRLLDKPKLLYLSSFRCLSRFVVKHILEYSGPFPYVDGLIMDVTQNIGRIEVSHLPRPAGSSNYTIRRLVRLWLNMFLNFSILPLRIATVVGVFVSVLGVLACIEVIGEVFLSNTPAGWGSLMASMLLLSGVQLLILGLVGEYLGRLYLTANRKPQFVTREVEHNPAWRQASLKPSKSSDAPEPHKR